MALDDTPELRRLIVVKVRHHTADMYDKEDPEFETESEAFQEHDALLEEYMDEVRAFIEDESVSRLYQDTYYGKMPFFEICGFCKLAQDGSPNAKLLIDLIAQDMEIMPTDDPEATEVKRIMEEEIKTTALNPFDYAIQLLALDSVILDHRDATMAENIDNSLQYGETWLLFIGGAHDVESALYERGIQDLVILHPAFENDYLVRLEQLDEKARRELARQEGSAEE